MVPVSLLAGWDSVAGIAAHYKLGRLGIQTQWWQDFLYLSRTALGPTQPPIQSINHLFSILSSTGTKKTQRFGNSHTEYIQQYK